MSREAETWELFAVTWKAMGFDFDENALKRFRAHIRTLSAFLSEVKKHLVPKGTRITPADLSTWTARFERVQRTHGQLMPLFRRESDKFAAQFRDAGAAWVPVRDE